MKKGYYDFIGNLVKYEGGATAYDIDAAEDMPVELLELSDYICSLAEGAEKFMY